MASVGFSVGVRSSGSVSVSVSVYRFRALSVPCREEGSRHAFCICTDDALTVYRYEMKRKRKHCIGFVVVCSSE